MALTTRIASTMDATQTSVGDLGTATFTAGLTKTYNWTSGTGTNQADRMWSDTGTITASSTTSLDLAGTGLLDPYGVAVVFVKLRMLRLEAATGNTNNVLVTRPASNGVPLFSAAGDQAIVQPGGVLEMVWPAGITVTAGTGDLIDLVNSGAGTSVDYSIMLIGTSA